MAAFISGNQIKLNPNGRTTASNLNDAFSSIEDRINQTQMALEFLIHKGIIDSEELYDFIASRKLAEKMSGKEE